MSVALAAAALALVAVLVELIAPGNPLYHAGWYNVALAALVVVVGMRMRAVLHAIPHATARAGAIVAAFGVAVVAFAGVASGLLGPDTRTIVGAPGESVRADELGGALAFPLAHASDLPTAALVRGSQALPIDRTRYVGAFVLRPVARTVVEVTASDARDAHLTITQPSGAAFLSPVLMMQNRQTIAGFDVPYDSFAVPAAHRLVKAVLFPPRIAASLPNLNAPPGTAAVLFDVESDTGKDIPNSIGVALDGGAATVGGLTLRPRVFAYPAVETIASPHLAAVALGLLCFLGGILTAVARTRKLGRP